MNDTDKLLEDLVANHAKAQRVINEQATKIFEHAKSYNNTVVTIGYAGFFAIWAFTKNSIPEVVSLHVAVAMGLSILLFVIYVVVEMLFHTFVTVKLYLYAKHDSKFTTPEEALKQSEEQILNSEKFKTQIKTAGLPLLVVWPFFFLPSLASGLYAAFLLMYNFLAELIDWLPYWPT